MNHEAERSQWISRSSSLEVQNTQHAKLLKEQERKVKELTQELQTTNTMVHEMEINTMTKVKKKIN